MKEHIAGFYITNADDLDAALAEDAVQDAFVVATGRWPSEGIPEGHGNLRSFEQPARP